MMLILFGLVAVFLPSISCSTCPHGNFIQSIIVDEGQSVILECYAGGQTNASVIWHREPLENSINQNISLPNGQKSHNGNVLELPSVTRHQRGIYICSVDDQCGNYSRYIKVTVHFVPIIIGTVREDRYGSKELVLRCNAESEPPAEIHWTKNYSKVKTSENLTIITDRELDDTLKSTLIQSNYDFEHQVPYFCMIENRLGEGGARFEPSKIGYTPKKSSGRSRTKFHNLFS